MNDVLLFVMFGIFCFTWGFYWGCVWKEDENENKERN